MLKFKRRPPLIVHSSSCEEKAQAIAIVNTGMTIKDASRSLGISYAHASVKHIKAYQYYKQEDLCVS